MSDFVDRFEKDVAKHIHRIIKDQGVHWMDSYAKSKLLSERWAQCSEKIDSVAARKSLSLNEIEYIIKKREHLNALLVVIDYIEQNLSSPVRAIETNHNHDFKNWIVNFEKCVDFNCLPHIKQIVERLKGTS